MIQFLSDTQLDHLNNEPKAIVFIHAIWSGPSVKAMEVFETWANECSFGNILIAKVDTYERPVVVSWLKSVERKNYTSTGSGEVLWLGGGKVVEEIPFHISRDLLDEITKRIWPNEQGQQNSPANLQCSRARTEDT